MDFIPIISGFTELFHSNNAFFFYYTIALLAFVAVSLAISARSIKKELSRAKRNHLLALAAVIVIFVGVELALVPVTVHLFSDEYIYMSMAKTMIYDHVAGICSFSTPLNCVPLSIGLFQQPVGWPLLLAVTYLSSGISLYGGLYTTLILSSLSVLLVFAIALVLFDDSGIALLSSCLFAATPLFLTYSRTMVSDTPALTFLLLSVLLALLYAKTRKMEVGVAAVAAILYTLLIKTDAILVIPVVFGCVLSYRKVLFEKGRTRREALKLAALSALFVVLALPQFAFLYNTNLYNNFGAINQEKFSLKTFAANLPQNAYFFFGSYSYMTDPIRGYAYNVEFPAVYTIFAIIGAALLLRRGRIKESGSLLIWFFALFIFYTAYYAGGSLFAVGIDIRYFLGMFPVVAVLASYGLLASWKGLSRSLEMFSKKKGESGAAEEHMFYSRCLLTLMLVLAFIGPFIYFATIVVAQPQNIYAFAAEREEQEFILGLYNSVPQDCFVLSYTPSLWYVLNRSNMYASWMNLRGYRTMLLNTTSCVYFVYDLDCQKSTTNPQYDNTKNGCGKIETDYTMEPVATDRYDKFGWNLTIGLYKVTGYSNGTLFR